jgi:ABC-2 type transport system permease protein
MNGMAFPARLGVNRGLLEFRQSMTSTQDVMWTVMINAIFIVVLIFQRGSDIEGVSLATLTLPSLLGMSVAFGGYQGIAGVLAYHREDGTLLRAKTVPQGMVGYLVAQIVLNLLNVVLGFVIMILAGLLLIEGFGDVGLGGWLTLVWVTVLGLLATLPWGAVVGSLVKSAASGFGLTFLPMSALVAISGIFYPITAMPGWVQGIAQVFPVYWLGLGVRSALLPEQLAAVELFGSWRHLETLGVLSTWAVLGLVVAPIVLRRVARRESGSQVAARREAAMHRIGP